MKAWEPLPPAKKVDELRQFFVGEYQVEGEESKINFSSRRPGCRVDHLLSLYEAERIAVLLQTYVVKIRTGGNFPAHNRMLAEGSPIGPEYAIPGLYEPELDR